MQVSYYPGCSLEATASDYAASIEGVARALDIELKELPDWNCCGATAAHSIDHRAALNLGARNLKLAQGRPQPVVVPCALCFNRLKSAQAELAESGAADHLAPEIKKMPGDPTAVEVVELNSFFTSPEIVEKVASKAVHELSGIRAVCYYGCQGQRPPKVTGNPACENPQSLDRLLTALGAEVLDWPFKTDCCGASHSVARPDVMDTLVARLYTRALDQGANCIVTGCQMCQANLDLYQERIAAGMGREVNLPVLYFTELMGLALGLPQTGDWLARHMTSPRAMLESAGAPRAVWERL